VTGGDAPSSEATLRALSGRGADELTLAAVRGGELGLSDLMIHPSTLEHQADVAAHHENPQLAENLRRAAELTRLADGEVLAIYEALRPRRSSQAELEQLADSLAGRELLRTAALVRDAAAVYGRRGLAG
jgi:propanediol dehydratase small subunit